ncbi:hypothetical protein BV112_00976 [Haemophilus influenzae]|uniref:Uncharacterized protein n=1 Tax=Haemophilus influenzae TaxID=727 RepID=A0A2R3GL46_HAEIF|nr:hypothetical protein CGSHiEE_01910 [Haemophilus influenzae PittEE]AJO89495.1 hypothetical protein NTHIC486_00759 [Haemophilus influenzae]EEP46133.1 hypothetical protein CGSHi7P49H1_06615 [Haemophilus influenzae 7P49H1]EEP47763.1 hypothetical protein CGSHi6P18H1_04252 [Haemophilus influenzae 6P18H1]AVI95410.1 hypothetical protein BV083_340 [Haemophilus influenzae]
MVKRKTFLKKKANLQQSSLSRNLRLRRLKHRKQKQFSRHSLQFVVQEICC